MADDLTKPAERVGAVTLSDSTTLQGVRGFYVGTTGDLKITARNGGTATLKALPAGVIVPIQVSVFWSTGTTAADVVALY